MAGRNRIRTDLALEATERFKEENVEVHGVEVREKYDKEKDVRTTVVRITTENGAKTMGKPQGTYITIEAPDLSVPDEDYHREISEEVAHHLKELIDFSQQQSVLVVGLGNQDITADSLYLQHLERLPEEVRFEENRPCIDTRFSEHGEETVVDRKSVV